MMPTTHTSQLSVSAMRALKRSRRQWVSEPDSWESHVELRSLPPGPHAPAKNEARVLRRICAQTGLSPDQVRQHKKYRVELSQAAKPQPGRSTAERCVLRLLKQVQRELALPHWHPELKALFLTKWEQMRERSMVWRLPRLDAGAAFALAMQARQR